MAAGILILFLNIALVAWVAWRLAGCFETAADRVIAALLLIPLQVIGGGLLLGYAGLLGALALTLYHVVGAVVAWRFLPAAPVFAFSFDDWEPTSSRRFALGVGGVCCGWSRPWRGRC